MGIPDFPTSDRRTANGHLLTVILGFGGAILGASLGFTFFTLLIKYVGIYAMAVPGLLVGLGCGFCLPRRSLILGIVCAIIAAATMIFAEWWNFPFLKDESLGFFLQNLGELSRLFWFSLILGSGLAFWFGQGNERTESRVGS